MKLNVTIQIFSFSYKKIHYTIRACLLDENVTEGLCYYSGQKVGEINTDYQTGIEIMKQLNPSGITFYKGVSSLPHPFKVYTIDTIEEEIEKQIKLNVSTFSQST